MFHIAIYLYKASNRTFGIGEFDYCIGKEIEKLAASCKDRISFYFLVHPSMMHAFGPDVHCLPITRRTMKLLNVPVISGLIQRKWPHFDLIHYTDQLPKTTNINARYKLMTWHDINFMHNHIPRIKKWKRTWRTARLLRRCTHLSFISNFAAHDVMTHFSVRVPWRIIPNGASDLTGIPSPDTRTLNGQQLPTRFLFSISRWAPKKGQHLMVEMMQFLPDHHLVLAGTSHDSYRHLVEETVRRLRLKNVTLLNAVSEEEKAMLYRNCESFLFPSQSEGFGLPVIEAMHFGKPTFLSRLTALPETGGDAAYYFDDLQPESMAATVQEGLRDFATDKEGKAMAIKAHAEKFSWSTAAGSYFQYYQDILATIGDFGH